MIVAVAGYLAAFVLAWSPMFTSGFPWTLMLLSLPALWITGVIVGRRAALAAGLYGAIGIVLWAAVSGEFLQALGAVGLALVAWDAAGLSFWLRMGDEVPNRMPIWRAAMTRSCVLASAGVALALGASRLELPLPFWAMVPLLIAVCAALIIFRRASAQHER
jgi:hypothetical protein